MKKKSALLKILTGTRQKFSDFQIKMNSLKQQREDRFSTGGAIPKSPFKDMHKVIFEVSAGTIAKATAVVLLLLLLMYFLYQISGILILLFVAFFNLLI